MRYLWRQLARISPEILTLVKRYSPAGFRFWIRQHCGADYRDIEERIVQLADGRRIRIERDAIFWPMDHGIEYEPEATHVFRALLRKGDIVVDGGANFGWYATLGGSIVGKDGRVFAFEPVSRNYLRLAANIELNDQTDRVVAVHAALSDAPGAQPIYYPSETEGAYASLAQVSRQWKSETVQMVRLDEFLAQRGVSRVNILKCDVEGAELRVLAGCGPLLRDDAFPILMLELNGEALQRFGCTKKDLWLFLRESGYDQFYAIDFRRSIRRVDAYRGFDGLDNCLCCKGNLLAERLASSDIVIHG